ncbi:HNH endonuclease [Streptomyces sp. NBC_01242]|uniref:HNH endonuclease n=1 Tax=Streptomyces sp. NBC_01242 TaxID=2903795 RepID=UPI00338F78B4
MSELARYLSKIDTSGGPAACHLWTGGTFSNGYGRFSLSDAKRSSVRSHRWGYTTLVGPIPPGKVVRHTCDVPLCHNRAHWILGTNGENSRDMVERRRSLPGTSNPASKLTEADVLEIKQLLLLTATGKGRTRRGQLTQKQIAVQFGVTQPIIRDIKFGVTWSHVS